MNAKALFQLGLINTVRINWHYFGWKGLIHPYIICSRNVKLLKLRGNIILKKKCTGIVWLGFGSVGIVDAKYERAIFENAGTIIFEGDAWIGKGSRLIVSGEVVFGTGLTITANSDIICSKKMTFGKNTLISWDCLFQDCDFHSIYYSASGQLLNPDKEITIGDHVWIGCRSTILKGCVIPNDSVIAAGSIVTKELYSDHTIYVGNCAKKNDISWEK